MPKPSTPQNPELSVPHHVALILDGNRRWARARDLPVSDGHRAGIGKASEVLQWCDNLGIGQVTLWMLSTDNVAKRSPEELGELFKIEAEVARRLAYEQTYRIRHLGSKAILPDFLGRSLEDAEATTRHLGGMGVNLAIGYGGRDDIVQAVASLYDDISRTGDTTISQERLASHLSTGGEDYPDLVIRTSGEQRMSDFMIWQTAKSELHFSPTLWPDFSETNLVQAVVDFSGRNRRLGG